MIERKIEVFSYPFGNAGDYSKETVNLVKSCGFTKAAVVKGGLYSQETNVYEIPRNNIISGQTINTFDRLLQQHWFEYSDES